jgi:hypothetical protein
LYQATSRNGNFDFDRLDTTIYFGYNVGSYAFSYNDSIYSLGGYGFWRTNGQLRVYLEKTKQWEIVKLNEEIPILCGSRQDLVWYDQNGEKLYIGRSFERNEAIKTDSLYESHENYEVSFLDLTKKEWHHMGRLNTYIIEKLPIMVNLTSTPWGELIMLGNKINLMDYGNNQLSSLNPDKADIVLKNLAENKNSDKFTFFSIGGILFWGSTKLNILDSLALQKSDFTFTTQPIFIKNTGEIAGYSFITNWSYVLFAFFLLMVIFIVFILGRKYGMRKQKSIPASGNKHEVSVNWIDKNLFDEKELAILHLVIANSKKGGTTTIEDLNKILGVTKKNVDIQKKQRSDAILEINRKYSLVTGLKEVIIEKKRSEFDKRCFEYYVNYSRINRLQPLLGIGTH